MTDYNEQVMRILADNIDAVMREGDWWETIDEDTDLNLYVDEDGCDIIHATVYTGCAGAGDNMRPVWEGAYPTPTKED